MKEQSYGAHTRLDPAFHMVAVPLALLNLIGSVIYLIQQPALLSAVLLVTSVVLLLGLAKLRMYATQLQDRVVRIEENFRHFVLTGKPLDPALSLDQIIGLRFASDAEFPDLCAQAVREHLSEDAIKRAVTHWRADLHRV